MVFHSLLLAVQVAKPLSQDLQKLFCQTVIMMSIVDHLYQDWFYVLLNKYYLSHRQKFRSQQFVKVSEEDSECTSKQFTLVSVYYKALTPASVCEQG